MVFVALFKMNGCLVAPTDFSRQLLRPSCPSVVTHPSIVAHVHAPADFSRQLSVFETQADSLPSAVEWCGSDGVVLLWPGLLLVVGPYGDHASWPLADDEQVSEWGLIMKKGS